MKKTFVILIIIALVVLLITQKSHWLPGAEPDEKIAGRASGEPASSNRPAAVRSSMREEQKAVNDFETTYRKVVSARSQGDDSAPATAVFQGYRFIQEKSLLTIDPNDPEHSSEEVKLLELDGVPEQDAVNVLQDLLFILKNSGNAGYFDTGPNIEMTNALLGYNYRKIGLIPANSKRINESGELIDKWGTPYFFHLISSTKVTIQSAGEDLTLFTEDDIMASSE